MDAIGKIDKNFAVATKIQCGNLNFYNVREKPFRVYGLLEGTSEEEFYRIPGKVAADTSEGVLGLYRNTAGGRIRFSTDSACVAIRAAMKEKCLMPHMTITGSSGFDLYVIDEGKYLYQGSFIPPTDRGTVWESLIQLEPGKMREILIHMPLYDNVQLLHIGLDINATVKESKPYRLEKPILYYGSSITQGGCASRPGNCYTNLISQKLDLDHVNLGFSGSARGEESVAMYIAGLSMSMFVLDYDHNSPLPQLEKNHENFFMTIRERNPDLPILIASRTMIPRTAEMAEEFLCRRNVIFRTYLNARNRGDKHVEFIDGSRIYYQAEQLGISADSCTVDGIHPNDLGFACMAEAFGQAIEEMLFKQ